MSSLTPDSYPGECTVTAEALQEVKDTLTDPSNDDWKSYVEDWPPSDRAGNVYPIFFTVDELNSRGEVVDSNGNNYNPFAGVCSPVVNDSETADYCNTPLNNWKERYPNIRFCDQIVVKAVDRDLCHVHKGRTTETMRTAEDYTQSGFFHKTIDHLYADLTPWQRLFGWGVYESLMGDSSYDFAVEYRPHTFDFSDEVLRPDDCDDDGLLDVKCGYPTEHQDPALSLYAAAMMGVQMVSVQPKIMRTETDETGEETSRMMESKTIESAQLTAPPSKHDPSPQQFKTLETWSEHHLNLPLSRLVNDRKKLLKMGGVSTDPDEQAEEISDSDIVVEIEADGDTIETTDDTGTDPNGYAVDGVESQSQKIVDSTNGDGE